MTVSNTFVEDAAIDVADLEQNFDEARRRYADLAFYGHTGRVHSGALVCHRVSPNLSDEVFTFRQNGLGTIDLSGLGAVLAVNSSSSFDPGTPVLTLTCLTLPDALGPVTPTWTWSGLSNGTNFALTQSAATANTSPNKLLPGLLYQLALTNTGSPGSPDFAEFGLYIQRYPKRGGGL